MDDVEVVVMRSGHPDEMVSLAPGTTRIGRAPDNELVLDEENISRRHAQIEVTSGEVVVEDLGSGNGTYHQGFKIQSRAMADGDEILIDPFTIRFRIPELHSQGETSPLRPAARLEVIEGQGLATDVFSFAGRRKLTIGRAEDQDIVLPDPSSSRAHCILIKREGRWVIRDAESANGVFVNEETCREKVLETGDVLQVGDTRLRFHDAEGEVADPISSNVADTVTDRRPDKPKSSTGLIFMVLFLFTLSLGSVGVLLLAIWYLS